MSTPATPVASPLGASPVPSPTPTPTNAEKAAAAAKAKANAEAANEAAVLEASRLQAEAGKAAQAATNAATKAAAIRERKAKEAAEAAAAAKALANKKAANNAKARQNAATTAEAAEAAKVSNSLLQANTTQKGMFTTPVSIQFVDAAKKGNKNLLEKLVKVLPGYSQLSVAAGTAPAPEFLKIVNNALFAAASGGYKECVTFLLENKASIKIRDTERNTILHAVVKSLKTPEQITEIRDIIDYVHEKDKTLFKEKNKNGETILHLAAKSPVKGSERIVNKILDLDGVDTAFVNSKTKNTNAAIQSGISNGRTALELVHNLNVTKVNNRGRAGRYPMYNVHFKKAKALLDKDATPITASISENAAVYPLLMKYYNKLDTLSGETANIKGIQNAAREAATAGKGVYGFEGAEYYNNLAKRLTAKAGLPGTSNTKKENYIRKAAKATQYARSIRNKRAKEAATKAASGITGVRKGLFGYTNNTSRARAVAAAAAAQNAAARAAAAVPRKKFLGIFGGTRKNRSRKNKSTRKNRKH